MVVGVEIPLGGSGVVSSTGGGVVPLVVVPFCCKGKPKTPYATGDLLLHRLSIKL